MDRIVFPLLIALLVTGVAGVDYSTNLHDEDLNRHFDIEGWIISYSDEKVDVALKYNLSLSHRYYNKSHISSFSVILADGEEGLIGKKLEQDTGMDSGGWVSGFGFLNSEIPPDRINRLRFLVNHTGTTTYGEKAEKRVSGRLKYSINSLDPAITSFRTNASKAERGEKLQVFAETEGIDNLTIEGRNMTANTEEFEGTVKVPEDAAEGRNLIGYELEDSRGNLYKEEINVTVENPPPEINLSYSQEVRKGQEAEIRVEVTDDLGINYTHVRFQGDTRQVEKGKVVLPTSKLYRGSYSFTVEAEDFDGRLTSLTRNFSIVGDSSGNHPTDSEETEGDGSEQSTGEKSETHKSENGTSTGTKSFPGVLTDPIIDFFRSLLG